MHRSDSLVKEPEINFIEASRRNCFQSGREVGIYKLVNQCCDEQESVSKIMPRHWVVL